MSRRGSPAVQVLVIIVIVLIFLYGFYSYHQQHTRLKLSEELSDKFKQKAESLSAQLQVLYEHKTRLETGIQKEKELHKATKENLELQIKELENKRSREKELNAAEFESCKKSTEELKLTLEKADQESKRLEQEHQNDVSRLKDDLANIKRRYEDCERLVNKPERVVVDKTRSQQQPAKLEIDNNNNNIIINGAGREVQSLQIVKPGDASEDDAELPRQQPNQEEKVDSAPQNIPVTAVPGVRQPDGRAVDKVNAPVVDSKDQQRDDAGQRKQLVAEPVNDIKAKQSDQLQRQPENRPPADVKNVNNAEIKDAAEDNYEDDVEGQQKKHSNNVDVALIAKPEANDAVKVVNVDRQQNDKDGAGL